jgi:hypothetical protein
MSAWTNCKERYASTELENYHQVALAVLEVDVSISCLKYDELSPAAHNHLVRKKYLQKH